MLAVVISVTFSRMVIYCILSTSREREIEIVNRDRQNLAASGVRKRLAGR